VRGKAYILFITHNRLGFSRITLPHLLESGGYHNYTVSVVDNASTDGTREWLAGLTHPRLRGITFNDENLPLREVTNRFWSESADAEFLGKVDNDTIIPVGFIGQAVKAILNPIKMGAVGAMHFEPTDAMSVRTSAFAQNLRRLPNGARILLQRHLGGCCYLIRSSVVSRHGYMQDAGYMKGGWTEYQWKLSHNGYPAAYLYPFMFAKHLDDPGFRITAAQLGEKIAPEDPEDVFRAKERKSVADLLSDASVSGLLPRFRG